MITYSQETQLRNYCGLNSNQAMALFNHECYGNEIDPRTVRIFIDGGLFDAETGKMTFTGIDIYKRVGHILRGDFVTPESIFNGPFLDELKDLDLRTLKHPALKAHGIRNIHLKVLRNLALWPRQVYGTLCQVFGEFALSELLAMEMIQCTTTRFSLVILSNKGSAFVATLVSGRVPAAKFTVVIEQ